MSILLLVRHGENDYTKNNRLPGRLAGIHLNERGRQQAEELSKALVGIPIKTIYSSPLERAIETAQPLAATENLSLQVIPSLTDSDVGHWAGRSWKSLRSLKACKRLFSAPQQFSFPGGESFIEIQDRVVTTFNEILSKGKEKEIFVIVSHADPIKLSIAHYIGLPIDNFQNLLIDTGSVSILKIQKLDAQLIGLNIKPTSQIALSYHVL